MPGSPSPFPRLPFPAGHPWVPSQAACGLSQRARPGRPLLDSVVKRPVSRTTLQAGVGSFSGCCVLTPGATPWKVVTVRKNHNWWLQATESYCLKVPEAGSPSSRGRRTVLPGNPVERSPPGKVWPSAALLAVAAWLQSLPPSSRGYFYGLSPHGYSGKDESSRIGVHLLLDDLTSMNSIWSDPASKSGHRLSPSTYLLWGDTIYL